jgi:hypothetical protein
VRVLLLQHVGRVLLEGSRCALEALCFANDAGRLVLCGEEPLCGEVRYVLAFGPGHGHHLAPLSVLLEQDAGFLPGRLDVCTLPLKSRPHFSGFVLLSVARVVLEGAVGFGQVRLAPIVV